MEKRFSQGLLQERRPSKRLLWKDDFRKDGHKKSFKSLAWKNNFKNSSMERRPLKDFLRKEDLQKERRTSKGLL